jgi:hypothetical protein
MIRTLRQWCTTGEVLIVAPTADSVPGTRRLAEGPDTALRASEQVRRPQQMLETDLHGPSGSQCDRWGVMAVNLLSIVLVERR